jgi:PAS domain S-box-containing protein
MGTLFAVNRLDEPELSEQLVGLLEEAVAALAIRWAGLVELWVEDGTLSPTWLACSQMGAETASIPLDRFERLSAEPSALHRGHPDLDFLAEPFRTCAAHLHPLVVSPRIATIDDTLLILAHDGGAPDSKLVAELCACLSRGLSRKRRERLARVVYAAIEQSGDALELTDREGRLFYVNRAWQKFTGYAADEALGKTVGQILRDRAAPLHDSAFYQFTMAELHAGRPWMGAISGRARDGHRIFSEVNVAPFHAERDGARGHVALRRDLSQRSERDAALAIAHHEFRAVLAAMTDGIVVLRDGRIYFANAAFTDIVGQHEREVIGRAYGDFVHPDDREQFEQEHRSKVTRVRVLRAGGSPRFVEISTAGGVSFEGKPATIVLSRDTTDYQLAREELSRAEKLSALGSLAAGVAHEINNPLAYVALNLDLLREQKFGPLHVEDREALDEAIEGVQRMREIASELRTFTGSDRKGPPEPVDVSRAITSALNLAQNEIRQRARLTRDCEEGLYVLAHEGALVQVLVNLLVNAAQAITSPSIDDQLIGVSCRALADDSVEIVVSDTGAGIAESALPHLFDAFSTSKPRGEGSGLGLAISRRIVDGFGGKISVESTLGKGTSVRVELPQTSGTPSLRPPRARRLSSNATRTLRILVVDDERLIARVLTRVLDPHEVVVAEDGLAAMRILKSDSRFDVVLCDLMMPRLPGAQFYAEVCRLHPKLGSHFVFMTGGAVTPSSKEFLRSFGGGVLWKPFDPWAALERVEEASRGAPRGEEREPPCSYDPLDLPQDLLALTGNPSPKEKV